MIQPSTRQASHPAGPQGMLRSLNERAALQLIFEAGPLTRGDVAERTGLSKKTAAAAIASLLERGAVRDVQPSPELAGRKGPTAAAFRVVPELVWAGGVDLGHDRVRVAIADVFGTVRARRERPAGGSTEGPVALIEGMLAGAAAEIGIDMSDIAQVVVGVPGSVGNDGRTLTYAEGLPDGGLGLGDALGSALAPSRLALENDVNLAALAESTQGVGSGHPDFILVSLGFGLGMGVVVDGRLYRGATGLAGEVGRMPIGRDGAHPDAAPGLRPKAAPDVLDYHVGSRYIEHRARALGLPRVGPRAVFDAAERGDPVALALVDETARGIAYVIAAAAPVLDPEVVILAGDIGADRAVYEPVLRHLSRMTTVAPRVQVSELGADGVLRGAVDTAVELARDAAFAAVTGSAPTAGARSSR